MADITMCSTEGCPLEGSCKRKLAKPSEYWQSYAAFDKEGCEYYWPKDD